MAATTVDKGHPGLWWPGGDVPDENPTVREEYDARLAAEPRPAPPRFRRRPRRSAR